MSVDETLLCSFQVGCQNASLFVPFPNAMYYQILKPAEKKAKFQYGGMNVGRPVTPPRKQKKKGDAKP